MLDRVLATMPPNRWAEVVRRSSVVSAYLDQPGAGADDAASAAAELGLNVRSFYRLARAYRLMREGGDVKRSRRGRHFHAHERISEVIGDTVRVLGREAIDAAVMRAATERCRAEGLPPPSMTAVRIRTGSQAGPVDLETRLRREFDVVVDACPLDLDLVPVRGAVDMAVLTVVHDGSGGGLLSHRLTVGWPRRYDVASTLSAAFPGARTSDAESTVLVATGGLAELLHPIAADLDRCGLRFDDASSRGLRPGVACVPVFGRRLGRVPLAPSRQEADAAGEAVAFHIAARVVDRMIADLPMEIRPVVGHRRLDGRADGPALRTLVQSVEF